MSGLKQLAVRSWKRAAALCLVTLALAVAGWAQGADRITQELGTGGVATLHGSVHRLVRRSTDLGEVNPAMPLNSLTMHFGLSAEQQIDMDALSAAQQDPKSPQYHQWLTQEEYATRFGLTDADLAKVTRWLNSQGFTVRGVSKSRNAIHFAGKASQVESAFHTRLHRYQLNGEQHFANATDLQIPAELRGVLLVVRGLNDFRPKPQLQRAAAPGYTVNTTLGIMNFLTPADWSTIYNVNAIYNSGYTGTGAYVGVVGQTYAPQGDINNFRKASGLGATQLNYLCISTSVNCTDQNATSTGGDLEESDLDIEWAGGVAKNATVVFVYAAYDDPNLGVFDALAYAVQDYRIGTTGKALPVISMSYTSCEKFSSASSLDWFNSLGQQANSQGQTIVVASGDTGAAGCDWGDYPAQNGVSASVPVDSPNYTGVGGTTLSGDESSPSLYWTETPSLVDSAKNYIPETVWNDTAADVAAGYPGLAASSGGVSQHFSQPTWQPTPTNYSGPAGRFVPDVAFAASADHDGYMTCSQAFNSTDCSSGSFGTSNGYLDVAGGTSAATPSFAGMLTLLEQKYGPQGNLNPTLYQMAANSTTYANVFHDIISGNNDVPCVAGTTGCVGGSAGPPAVSGTMGFSATPGYDLTTGLGSINGGALFTALGSRAATTTAVTAPTGLVALNGTITLTATVSSTTAGTITGTVMFSSATMVLGSAAVSSGTATLSVAVTAANGLATGTDLVTASYVGDSNFGESSGNAELTVYDPSAPPPLVSLSTAGSVVAGQPSGFTLTVNGANFATNAKVLWNGAVRATTRVSSTQLTATILAADIAKEQTVLVTVSSTAPAETSAALPFAVMSSTPVATITAATLTVATDGSGNHVLTLTGTDFVSGSVAKWNGTILTTSVASPWQLSAVVTGAEFGARPAGVTVANPAGTSAGFTLP